MYPPNLGNTESGREESKLRKNISDPSKGWIRLSNMVGFPKGRIVESDTRRK